MKTNTIKNKIDVPRLSLMMISLSFVLNFIMLIWFAFAILNEGYVRLAFISITILSLISIAGLFFITYLNWKKTLQISLDAKIKYATELEAAHTQLQNKVEQRTVDLQTSNNELTQSLENMNDLRQVMIQSEKMAVIGELSAGLAHEINNPLGFVMSNITTLKTELALIEKFLSMHQDLISEIKIEDVDGLSSLSIEDNRQQPNTSNKKMVDIFHQINQFSQVNKIPEIVDRVASH